LSCAAERGRREARRLRQFGSCLVSFPDCRASRRSFFRRILASSALRAVPSVSGVSARHQLWMLARRCLLSFYRGLHSSAPIRTVFNHSCTIGNPQNLDRIAGRGAGRARRRRAYCSFVSSAGSPQKRLIPSSAGRFEGRGRRFNRDRPPVLRLSAPPAPGAGLPVLRSRSGPRVGFKRRIAGATRLSWLRG